MTLGDSMSRMTIGVWLEEDWNPEEGGGYTFHQALIDAIDRHEFANAKVVFVTAAQVPLKFSKPVIRVLNDEPSKSLLSEEVARSVSDENTRRRLFPLHAIADPLRKAWSKLVRLAPCAVTNYVRRVTKGVEASIPSRAQRIETALAELVASKKIDVFYFPIPQHEPVNFDNRAAGIPYISSLWDLGHVSTFAFPEFSYNGSWAWRDNWSRRIPSQALFVICESESGKREALSYLNLCPQKVGVVPFFLPRRPASAPGGSRAGTILDSIGVSAENFFFYPAQFWPHKNHFGLLAAFTEVIKTNPSLRLVLTGAEKGSFGHVRDCAHSLGVAGNVVFGGFLDNDSVTALYRNAIALVMPTFLGPTNLPLLEAMLNNCPVICSDFPGHREMLGEAAFYVDPTDRKGLADAMTRVLVTETRHRQKALLLEQQRNSHFTAGAAMMAIDGLLPRIEAVRRCWS